MDRRRGSATHWLVVAAVAVMLSAGVRHAAGSSNPSTFGGGRLEVEASLLLVTLQPNMDRDMQRTVTRAERSVARFGFVLGYVALLWLWVMGNVAAFLLVVTLASVADLRMLALRRQGVGAVARYLINGGRMFMRLLRDRRTPALARLVLAVALLYWFAPIDVVGERLYLFDEEPPALLSFIDDVVVAILAAKLFMYLCPDSLVAQHAEAIDGRTHVPV